MWEWTAATFSLIGAVAVAVIGGRSAHKTSITKAVTPAYAELIEEVKGYRKDAREDRERIEQLEAKYDEERTLRRELDGRVQCLERARDADRAWIRRVITAIRASAPEHVELLRPFPDWHETDPDGFPPVGP